ncbi:MAG: ABC transporter permease [Ruminococcaceae bacterium]|nr:ABC transporter permease [Oscillospiraceae bacterium]
MLRFIIKRTLIMVPIIIGVIFIVFSINRLSPADPVAASLGSTYTEEQYAKKEAEMGLDKPFFVQFFNYLKGIVTRFDLGTSYQSGTSVSEEVLRRLPTTVKLGLIGCLITIVLGIPFGIISAKYQYSLADYSVTVFSLIFASMPAFWLGLMLIIIFSLNLKWFPASMASRFITWKHWVLPALAIGLTPVASITRLTRSSMLDVIRQDYIRTAKAKGVPEGPVVMKHALKNALIPVITSLGLQLGMLVSGSVVVETIFSIPGLGSLITQGISNADYPVVQGCVVILAAMICVINLLTDIAYALVDPRIMSQYTSSRKRKKKAPAARKEAV